MDFGAMMAAQMAKITPSNPSTTSNSTSTFAATSSSTANTATEDAPERAKYLKRQDVEAAREAAYLAEQAAREAERVAKARKKRQLEDEASERNREREAKRQRLAVESKKRAEEDEERVESARRKRLRLPELPPKLAVCEAGAQGGGGATSGAVREGEEDVTEDALLDRLRAMAEPAKLFGETHTTRLRRYHRLVQAQSNAATAGSGSGVHASARSSDPIPTTLEPVAEANMKVATKLPPASDTAARQLLARQLTSWFTLVLKAWAVALGGRAEAVKKTFQGQAASNSLTQALSHLTPLFRKLEKLSSTPAELPDDLLEPMLEIVHAAQERRYVDANDGYLRLSIGKAAWPIGVTMVGIHERSAREKLHGGDKGKAHIMSDETTRKILQSIKRCLSFAQTRWPPEDMGQLMG